MKNTVMMKMGSRGTAVARALFVVSLLIFISAMLSHAAPDDRPAAERIVAADSLVPLTDTTLSQTTWVKEKTGDYLPMAAEFQNSRGTTVILGDLIVRPTLLIPVYFYCPNVCTLDLANLANSLYRSDLQAGQDYNVIALSFSHSESAVDSSSVKRNYMKLLPDTFPEESWQFLTGSEDNIRAVTDAIGYKFSKANDGTFVHASALVALAGDGKIIKYVYGKFPVGDLELALAEAQKGIPALSIKRVLNYCFNYDPTESETRTIFTSLKVAGLVLFGVCILFFVALLRRGRKERHPQ